MTRFANDLTHFTVIIASDSILFCVSVMGIDLKLAAHQVGVCATGLSLNTKNYCFMNPLKCISFLIHVFHIR